VFVVTVVVVGAVGVGVGVGVLVTGVGVSVLVAGVGVGVLVAGVGVGVLVAGVGVGVLVTGVGVGVLAAGVGVGVLAAGVGVGVATGVGVVVGAVVTVVVYEPAFPLVQISPSEGWGATRFVAPTGRCMPVPTAPASTTGSHHARRTRAVRPRRVAKRARFTAKPTSHLSVHVVKLVGIRLRVQALGEHVDLGAHPAVAVTTDVGVVVHESQAPFVKGEDGLL
jgi:hypothetical protein